MKGKTVELIITSFKFTQDSEVETNTSPEMENVYLKLIILFLCHMERIKNLR